MQPLISVLIPIYNVEKYIGKCARSLFNNTFANKCEFIFVNDCTPDKSVFILEDVIKEFPHLSENIKIINHQKNQGLGTTRNTGFDASTGKYIICTDSDDWVEPEYLELLYNKADETNADLVGCQTYVNFEDSEKFELQEHLLKDSSEECLKDLFYNDIGAYLWIKLIRRDFLLEKNIRWVSGINMWEDQLLFVKILCEDPVIAYLDKPLYHYLLRNGSYINSLYNIKKADNVFNAMKLIESHLQASKYNYLIDNYYFRVFYMKNDVIFFADKEVQKKYLMSFPQTLKYINAARIDCSLTRKIVLITSKYSYKFALFQIVMISYIKKLTRKSFKNYK